MFSPGHYRHRWVLLLFYAVRPRVPCDISTSNFQGFLISLGNVMGRCWSNMKQNVVWKWSYFGQLLCIAYDFCMHHGPEFCNTLISASQKRCRYLKVLLLLFFHAKIVACKYVSKQDYSISQEICTRFLLCCALLWLYIDWFSHIHQAYFTGTVAI